VALAEEGADVVISYSASADKADEVVKTIQTKGVRGLVVKADQGHKEEVETLVKSVAEKFGKLDILVNNAAICVIGTACDDVDEKEMTRQNAVNIDGTITAIRTAAKILPEGGRIITIGSGTGTRVGFAGAADYAATKSAVAGYSRGAARDLAPRNITVNVIQPGFIETDMNPSASSHGPMFTSMVAMGRYGRPEEIAAGVVFLASPQASYVTGTVLNIDGGSGA